MAKQATKPITHGLLVTGKAGVWLSSQMMSHAIVTPLSFR
jgi:hypothetical protein